MDELNTGSNTQPFTDCNITNKNIYKNFTIDIKKQYILIEGKEYRKENIPGLMQYYIKEYGEDSFHCSLAAFLEEWFNDSPLVKVHTSGSTGTPKELWVEKQRMINSAVMTLSFLGLKKSDKALLCMPMKYIAGKMVVVRSLVAGLDIIPVVPCGRPMQNINIIPEFAAMIPMQVFNSLQNEEDKEKLSQIKNLIIGGGAIDENLSLQLSKFPNPVWSTYGMTETLSHIALRRISGEKASKWYTPFEYVKLSSSEEGALIIDAPLVSKEKLYTNDIVEFNSFGQFTITGRKDNIINTGGVKVQIEKVEEELKKTMPDLKFMITSVPDEKFGERIILLLENKNMNYDGTDYKNISIDSEKCQTENKKQKENKIIEAISTLPKFWRPKNIIYTDNIPLTETGKPDRANAKKLAKSLSLN